MKNIFSILILSALSMTARADVKEVTRSTVLDATSVVLADVLVKPKIRECIDSTLLANGVTNGNSGSFSVKEVETYTAEEPLFPDSKSTFTQSVTHYILKTKARYWSKDNTLQSIGIVFDIKISSGTGILFYSCSSQVL